MRQADKPFRGKPVAGLKAPQAPRVTKARDFVAQFAHHPPSLARPVERMERPHGGHGPHN